MTRFLLILICPLLHGVQAKRSIYADASPQVLAQMDATGNGDIIGVQTSQVKTVKQQQHIAQPWPCMNASTCPTEFPDCNSGVCCNDAESQCYDGPGPEAKRSIDADAPPQVLAQLDANGNRDIVGVQSSQVKTVKQQQHIAQPWPCMNASTCPSEFPNCNSGVCCSDAKRQCYDGPGPEAKRSIAANASPQVLAQLNANGNRDIVGVQSSEVKTVKQHQHIAQPWPCMNDSTCPSEFPNCSSGVCCSAAKSQCYDGPGPEAKGSIDADASPQVLAQLDANGNRDIIGVQSSQV